MRALPQLLVAVALLLAVPAVPAGAATSGFDTAFFGDMPPGYDAAVEACANGGQCGGLDAFNRGPQIYTLTMWGRPVSETLFVEIIGDRLMVDARELSQLIASYYRWPEELPRRGVVDLRTLPGLVVKRDGLTIALTPEQDYALSPEMGGARVVAPEDFSTPGNGVFASFNLNAGYDEDRGMRGRFDAVFGAQAGLWQFRSRGSIDLTGDRSRLDYAYVDRPILSRALRFQGGYFNAAGACTICASGPMLGVSLGSDSLNGMLYETADTAYLDIVVDGAVSQIEIVVNGRSVRRESAFPGFHTIAVTALEDGPNFIEIYGIEAGGGRRLLAATQKTASGGGVLGEGIKENRVQAGWFVGSRRTSHSWWSGMPDFSDGIPFVQAETRRGLGNGREFAGTLVLSSESAAIETGMRLRIGRTRTTFTGIGSYGEGIIGGGGTVRLDRVGRTSLALTGRVCFDCYDISRRRVVEGLRYDATVSVSRLVGGWSAAASLGIGNDTWRGRDTLTARADLRRPLFGGQAALYVRDSYAIDGSDRHRLEGGFSFVRILGGSRIRQAELGVSQSYGQLTARATYRDSPSDGIGFYGSATVEGYGLDDPDRAGAGLTGSVGYRDAMVHGLATAGRRRGRTHLDFNIGSGFALIDGQLVISDAAENGGVIASGLAPGSTVFVGDQPFGTVNRFGQAHLTAARRGHFALDEKAATDGDGAAREADLVLVPGRYYAIGPDFAAHETSYLIGVGREMVPPPPGLALFDGRGETVGYTGYEGVTTISGPPDGIAYDDGFETCTLAATGDDVPGSLVRQLRATCVANAAPRIAPVPPATAPRLPPEIAGAEPEGQREASLADRF